ncbi:hypothetical protein [Streptomyces sp. DSM 40750]|uniref:hypothetical protein n=1 Tax=Streptomyces sp. DSM 40750 TaxID=2801030 RepID=UPI00214C21AC|nr:hypothetical protein [Streptomyces sp. DSM 40750]UUU19732.1 hypothetical protein JIX55_05115 [Streptomyces sp. DSM 40750]
MSRNAELRLFTPECAEPADRRPQLTFALRPPPECTGPDWRTVLDGAHATTCLTN